jgi:hypothetical protein
MLFSWIFSLLLRDVLKPGGIHNCVVNLRYGQNETLVFQLGDLEPSSTYEIRVPWPGTSPIRNHFFVDGTLSTSDEKVVFVAHAPSSESLIIIEAIGVSRDRERPYEIPLNTSLEKQHFGITVHVWRLACALIPTLIAGLALLFCIFPPD